MDLHKTGCPFEKGDRVDHKFFGFGTIIDVPAPMVGVIMESGRPAVFDGGWRVRVRWDDEKFSPGDFSSSTLTKIVSPDAQAFSYWDCRWQLLFKNWIITRRDVEAAAGQLYPSVNSEVMDRLIEAERAAKSEMDTFIAIHHSDAR